jgi:O-antigen/teichoic acid export membrane protein
MVAAGAGEKSLFSQLSVTTLGHGLEKAVALLIVMVLVRHVDKASMGEFFFAIGVCTVATLLNEFGTSRYLMRSIAQDRERAATYLGAVLRLRLPLLAVTLAGIVAVVGATAPQLLQVFIFTSIYILFENLYYAFGATLLGIGAVATRVMTGLIGPLLLLALVPAAALLDWPLARIVVLYALASTVMALVGYLVVVRRIGPVTVLAGTLPGRDVLLQCALLFAVNAVVMLHARVDEWMLASMRDFREVAGYAAGYKLAEVSRSAIRPITMMLLPLLAAAAAGAAWERLRTHARRALWTTACISVAVAAFAIAIAPWIVPLLFGHDYPETVAITRVLFLATPAMFVGYVAILINSSLHLDGRTLRFAVASVLVNIALNLLAIPRWGALGAAWATLITESLFSVALLLLLLYGLPLRMASRPALAP